MLNKKLPQNQNKKMLKNTIFISHSSIDLEYVKTFVEIVLRLGLDIPSERIFCSSVEGQGIKSGQYIPDRLRDEMNKSTLAILFISKNYKASEICLNEVGAAWVLLGKEAIIPMLLPDIDFNELGFLDINRLGLRLNKREGILKFIQDCRELLNPNFDLEKLYKKIEEFLSAIECLNKPVVSSEIKEEEEFDEWTDCFENNLYALNSIIRKAIPANEDGIHKINDFRIQNQILSDLSQAKFLKSFWYRYAGGDYFVEKLRKLPSGNWLLSIFNLEIKISELWVCMDTEPQYEFILIKSEKLEHFNIESDIGGSSFNVGILKDGTIVSENERLNGYAIINGENININELGVEPRIRHQKSHWIFLISTYHKAGFNDDETIAFCEKLDNGEVEVNEKNIYTFLRSLKNHPIVGMFR